MHPADLSYLTAVSLAGALCRALRRGLPEGWRQRLEARPPEDLPRGWVWVHAVSVGELLLAEGLLGRLRARGHALHVTTGTPAGLELLRRRLPDWDAGTGRVTGGAFPLDDPAGLAPFLHRPPAAFVALETELWPNLLRSLEARGIPRAVVNGRLTPRSLARGGPWLRRAAARLSAVAARDEASAEAFRALGAPEVQLGGNLKADLPAPKPLHAGWHPLRAAWEGLPVVVVGNTVAGEEAMVLSAWRAARERHAGLRLVIAPRQPRRFAEVAGLLAQAGLAFRRASEPWPEEAEAWRGTEVLLLDTLGELAAAYAEGTVALVGGGWRWEGGHNPLEPARFGLPVLVGPGYANFGDLVEPLRAAGRLRVVAPEALPSALGEALDAAPGLRPARLSPLPGLPEALRGALDRTEAVLKKVLPDPMGGNRP